MPFSEETLTKAWRRAKGQCECLKTTHDHMHIRCTRELVWDNRGNDTANGAWKAHYRNKASGDSPSNCEILCWACHHADY